MEPGERDYECSRGKSLNLVIGTGFYPKRHSHTTEVSREKEEEGESLPGAVGRNLRPSDRKRSPSKNTKKYDEDAKGVRSGDQAGEPSKGEERKK